MAHTWSFTTTIGFRLVSAFPINSNTIRAVLSKEPRHQSALSSIDALNRLNWHVVVSAGAGSDPVVERVENALPQPTLFAGFPDAWSVDLRVDVQLLLATTYETRALPSSSFLAVAGPITSVDGDAMAADPNDRHEHPGIVVPRPRRPPRSSRAAVGVDLRYDTFDGIFRLDGKNDIDVHAGPDALRKRIIRRLITARGGFRHLPTYGVGLRVKEINTTTSVAALRSEILRQVRQERDVADVDAVVQSLPGTGAVIIKITVKPAVGTDFDVTFEVPSTGPITIG